MHILKSYLEYAERGRTGTGSVTGKPHDSSFEAEVAERLTTLGIRVDAQVGVSGFSGLTSRFNTASILRFTSPESNATAQLTIQVRAHEIETDFARKCCADWAGRSSKSGRPIGSPIRTPPPIG